jgi:hypothetical protein
MADVQKHQLAIGFEVWNCLPDVKFENQRLKGTVNKRVIE